MFKKREFKGEDTFEYSFKIKQELDSRLRGVEKLLDKDSTGCFRALYDNEATAVGIALRALDDGHDSVILPSQFVEKCNGLVKMYADHAEYFYECWQSGLDDDSVNSGPVNKGISLWHVFIARELYGIVTDVCIGL